MTKVGLDSDAFPLISIITPVLNCEKMLKNFICQIRFQTYKSVELIIIDGGSHDGTVSILKSLDNYVDYWISEPDRGIYDAMNKGIDAARGRWLFFAGVDDRFTHPEIIENIFTKGEICSDTKLICGNVVRGDGKKIKSRFNRWLYFKNTLPHQGVFYRRDIFDHYRYGRNAENKQQFFYKISGDYHLNLFLFMHGTSFKYIDLTVMHCGPGRSLTRSFIGYREEIAIRRTFLGNAASFFFDGLTLLRFIGQRCFAGRVFGCRRI